LVVGDVFELVRGAVAACLHSQDMARFLEKDALQQREGEGSVGLDTKGADVDGIAPLF